MFFYEASDASNAGDWRSANKECWWTYNVGMQAMLAMLEMLVDLQ